MFENERRNQLGSIFKSTRVKGSQWHECADSPDWMWLVIKMTVSQDDKILHLIKWNSLKYDNSDSPHATRNDNVMSQLQIFHVTSLAQAAPGRQEAFNTFLVVKATQGVSQPHFSIYFIHDIISESECIVMTS